MSRRPPILALVILLLTGLLPGPAGAAGGHEAKPAYPAEEGRSAQYAHFPIPVQNYEKVEGGILATIKARAAEDPFNIAATLIFFLAIVHTFTATTFLKLAHRFEEEHRAKLALKDLPDHPDAKEPVCFKATLFHFLGEVEAIFGIWVIALAGAAAWFYGWEDFTKYISHDRQFTEPIFVVVVMAIASSRPVLRFAERVVALAANLGKGTPAAWWLSILIITPVLGSFITEPAAITIAAMLLAKKFYRLKPSRLLAYGTIGLLFVNISVGGTLTHFAAPPVLMVASTWGWDTLFMLKNFGYKAVLGVVVSTAVYWSFFRGELFRMGDAADGAEDGVLHPTSWAEREDPIPWWVTLAHLFFLGWTVANAHYPILAVGGFLFFLAFVFATEHHQNSIRLRSPLLVGFFLGGLIIHGGCQSWWIEPVINNLEADWLMLGATLLTAFNDNAAITYLAAQVPDISEAAKHAVVYGAVTGGGLTVIANAPNPAGQSILSRFFKGGVNPLGLVSGALIPTVIVYLAFSILPSIGGSHAATHEAHDAKAPAAEAEAEADATTGH